VNGFGLLLAIDARFPPLSGVRFVPERSVKTAGISDEFKDVLAVLVIEYNTDERIDRES
jgi:hypothetical protein